MSKYHLVIFVCFVFVCTAIARKNNSDSLAEFYIWQFLIFLDESV